MLTTIITTAVLTLTLREAIPYVKQVWNALLKRISRASKPNKPIPAINKICIDLENRVSALEAKVNKRHNNNRQYMRDEIRNVLMELKK